MFCAGIRTPVAGGESSIDFCYDHFEPRERAESQRPAFVLHAAGMANEERTAAFVLAPSDDPSQAQWFKARWGRTGVGPAAFLPIPAQTDDDRPGIEVYGSKATDFTWRSFQWEIIERIAPHSVHLPSLYGEVVEIPDNPPEVYALREGVPIANVDALPFGVDSDTGIAKEPEEGADRGTYRVRFGGRIWRRRAKEGGAPHLELLAFDPQSAVLQSALDHVWGEIGGQDEAKRELIRAIQWPVLYPELFVLFKRRRSRGVLLYGPPGCGKTLLGKAVVRLLAALYHRKADDGGFKYVKGHQLLDMYVGNSEKAVKALFDDARRWREQQGYPAVLFFDEADALFKRRPGGSRESGFTLVPALLAEMDGMEESGAFLMLATNRPDALDPAIMRPGRVDRRIRVTRPDRNASQKIFQIHLDGVFLEEGLSLGAASEHAAREMHDPRHVLYEVEWEGATETAPFRLRDLASGALIQNIVDRATANKMEYCIERGVTVGLSREDLTQATLEVLGEHREMLHTEELEEFGLDAGRGIAAVRRPA